MAKFAPSPISFLASLVLVTLFLIGCYPAHPQSTFDAAGPIARAQLNLFVIIFWAGVFVFVTVEGALLYMVLRFRRRRGEELPMQVHGNTRLEIAWTIAPAIVLAVIAVPTIQTIVDTSQTPREALQVRVIGHQWWWEFQYPDQKIVTANELHIPVGQPVSLILESQDVIHSFWVPKLAGKQDAIPTRHNPLWLKADRAGEFYGQCAEFCGTSHANMRLRVIAQPAEEFQSWVKAQQAPPGAPASDATKGAEIFAKGACVACHTIQGTEAKGKIGPDLTHLASRGTFAGSLLDRTPENLAKWLKNPSAVKPGAKMPNLNLSEEDVSALVAYLQSLK